MKRILFVDDEVNILAGLKRAMHSMRQEWDMEFVDDPEVALHAFRERPFDIVVSDMKMPKLDGADLLAEIKRFCPESIRIILSGHSEPALIMKSVGPTHQYLAKPCESGVLKKTIERAYALKELVSSEALQKLVSGIGELPSLPSAYQEIVARLQDEEASIVTIGRIIEEDVAMTTKILQLVNSAFFGIANPVVSIEQAVSLLGLDILGTLVLAHGIFSQHEVLDKSGFDVEALRNFSIRCAASAKIVAEEQEMSSTAIDEAFLAGMLHDVGKLVLASELPNAYAEVLRRAGGQDVCADEIELEVLGATHGQVGAYLIGLWGLPDAIVEAVAYHEIPSQSHSTVFDTCGVVHVASKLTLDPGATDPANPSLRVDMNYLRDVAVVDRWCDWQTACQHGAESEEFGA